MKIAIDGLAAKSLYHGMGVYIDNLVRYIIPNAKEHSFIFYGKSANYQIETDNRFEYKKIQLSKPMRLIWEQVYLPFVLKRERVDLFWGPSNFLPPIKVSKYLVTIHDISSFIYAKAYPFSRRLYYQYLILNSVHRADCIITVSESSKQDLMRYFRIPENKVKVIYNGVAGIFQQIKSRDNLLRVQTKYQLPKRFVFSLGVLEPKKNIERLISAYAQIKKSGTDLPKLVLGGSKEYGWKNSKVFQLIKTFNLADDIVFTDFIDYEDLPAVYNLAELFVFPSIYEGFGLPVIEAMACGTPVITSNTSSLPEVAGDAAVLVNPHDVSDIANAILKVLSSDSEKQEMVEKGFENIKRFSWQKAASEIIEVFDEVCRSGKTTTVS